MTALSHPAARKLGAASYGSGSETLLFLNGFGTEQSVWAHQVARFGAEYQVVTFDHVGSGQSDIAAYEPSRYGSLYDYADDVLALMDALNPAAVTLVGHSAGAMVAAAVCASEPARCRGLIMIGGSPRYLNAPGYEGGFDPGPVQQLLDDMRADYHAWATGFSRKVANPAHQEVAERYEDYLRSMRPDIAHATLSTIMHSDLRELLPRVRTPALVIQADEDIAVPATVGRYLARHLPHARLEEIDYTGHLPHMLVPQVIGDLIAGFLHMPAGGRDARA